MGHRSGALFVRDWRQYSRPIDRNERVKIVFLAERLDVNSKAKGCRNGCLGDTGLKVLRALMYGFLNCATGLCCPSYDSLQRATGLSRQSIADCLDRLETVGILHRQRRLCRQRVGEFITTTNATSLYSFWRPLPQSTEKRPSTFRGAGEKCIEAMRRARAAKRAKKKHGPGLGELAILAMRRVNAKAEAAGWILCDAK